jgi:hypothetical protein
MHKLKARLGGGGVRPSIHMPHLEANAEQVFMIFGMFGI